MTKILIIDDDRLDRMLIRKAILQSHNDITIIELNSGETAIETIEKEKPDLTVLDICMYGIDGFEVLGRIRSNASIKKHPVIILSGSQRRVNSGQSAKSGADGYYVKPHNLQGYREIATSMCNHPVIAA